MVLTNFSIGSIRSPGIRWVASLEERFIQVDFQRAERTRRFSVRTDVHQRISPLDVAVAKHSDRRSRRLRFSRSALQQFHRIGRLLVHAGALVSASGAVRCGVHRHGSGLRLEKRGRLLRQRSDRHLCASLDFFLLDTFNEERKCFLVVVHRLELFLHGKVPLCQRTFRSN